MLIDRVASRHVVRMLAMHMLVETSAPGNRQWDVMEVIASDTSQQKSCQLPSSSLQSLYLLVANCVGAQARACEQERAELLQDTLAQVAISHHRSSCCMLLAAHTGGR